MSATLKKRAKSTQTNPNSNPSSSSSSHGFLKEPSSGFFPTKEEFLKLLAVVLIALAVAMTCNYASNVLNHQPKPFCDSSAEDSLSDVCEPCPKNGECSEGNLECLPGYKKYGRSCVEDGEINQTAKKLSEWVELRVCEAYVHFLCDRTGTIWVPEVEVWKELDDNELKEKLGLNHDSYIYAKQRAMEMVEGTLETHRSLYGIKELKCPDWLVEHYKPLSCCIRQWISSHALILVAVFPLVVGFITLVVLLLRSIQQKQYLSTRSEELYHQVCEILEENAIAAKSVDSKYESWVIASQLRDHLLLPRERKDPLLWKKVEEFVQQDSRLDQYPKLVKGEQKVVWEWQVEGSLSSSRKRAAVTPSTKLGSDKVAQKSPIPQQRPRGGEASLH